MFQINRVFVYRTVKRLEETETVNDCKRCDRPRSSCIERVVEVGHRQFYKHLHFCVDNKGDRFE